MVLLDGKILGLVILFFLGVLVVFKQITTGSVLDRPKGNLLVQLVNSFNLFFLLIVNPLAHSLGLLIQAVNSLTWRMIQ